MTPYAVPLPQGFSLYPLTIAALLVPLTWLPVAVAQFGWFALNVAALVEALATLDRLWVPEAGAPDVRRHLPFLVRLAAVAAADWRLRDQERAARKTRWKVSYGAQSPVADRPAILPGLCHVAGDL